MSHICYLLFCIYQTLQIISFLAYLKYERGITGPHLVVVPLSVMSSWSNEFKRWCPSIRVVRYHGPLAERRRLQKDEARFGQFDVILTTYEMIVGDEDFFRWKFVWRYLIVDEAHRLKVKCNSNKCFSAPPSFSFTVVLTNIFVALFLISE